jgi:hypothetical protein
MKILLLLLGYPEVGLLPKLVQKVYRFIKKILPVSHGAPSYDIVEVTIYCEHAFEFQKLSFYFKVFLLLNVKIKTF